MTVRASARKYNSRGVEHLSAQQLVLGNGEFVNLVPCAQNAEHGVTYKIHHTTRSRRIDQILTKYPAFSSDAPDTFPDLRICGLPSKDDGFMYRLIHGQGIDETYSLMVSVEEIKQLEPSALQ